MKALFFLLLISINALAQDDCTNCNRGPIIQLPRPILPDWPLKLIDIKTDINYKRNKSVEYCKRPVEILDTIVFHHSETPPSRTAQDMNQYHIDRGWYMGGYSYVVNSAYEGTSSPAPLVSELRPLDLVGSHAGTEVFVPMDNSQKEIWDSGKVVCGKEGGDFKVDPEQIKGDKIKANVTTLGVVVVGNYAPYSRQNPSGYPASKPRYPSDQTQDMLARLSCQLQKKYPAMKNIRWHNYYHSTDCPGTIKKFIEQIKAKAKGYGCDFT